MNSAEQKDFEHVSPSDEEIKRTISFITQKLNDPALVVSDDKVTVEGYTAAVDILLHDKKMYDQIPEHIKTEKARAIAVLAVNYLNGECSREVLLGYGFKN